MSDNNPHHPQALTKAQMTDGAQVLWCSDRGVVIKRAVVAGPPLGATNPWIPLHVSYPHLEFRHHELFQMGVIPHPETGAWAPGFTILASQEASLPAPEPKPHRRIADFDRGYRAPRTLEESIAAGGRQVSPYATP